MNFFQHLKMQSCLSGSGGEMAALRRSMTCGYENIALRTICFGLPASKKLGQIFLREKRQFEFSTLHPSEIYHAIIKSDSLYPPLQGVGGWVPQSQPLNPVHIWPQVRLSNKYSLYLRVCVLQKGRIIN
jgi:hypothetical protein